MAGKAQAQAVKQHPLVGARVVAVRSLDPADAEAMGWRVGRMDAPVALVLSTGEVVFPSRDGEGNGPGALYVYDGTRARLVTPGRE